MHGVPMDIQSFISSIDMLFMQLFLCVTFLLPFIIPGILTLLFFIAFYIAEAFPLYKMAKKVGRKNAWLVWIPIFSGYFSIYVMMDIARGKEVVFFSEKYTMKSRPKSYIIFVLGSFAISTVLTMLILGAYILTRILGNIMPFASSMIFFLVLIVAAILFYIPAIALTIIRYVYLRDLLDVFKEDKKSNNIMAIVVTLLDRFVTCGIARVIILYTIMNLDPLPEETMEIPTEAFAETISE